MEIRQIRYFLTIQETGSFTKASEKLFVTQPTLSAAIKSLEEELGAKLLKRGRQVTLTPAGLRFRDRAFAILAECNAAKSELMATQDQKQIRIGILNTLNTPQVSQLLESYRTTYPEVQLHIDTGNRDQLAHKLGQDKVDILITSLSGKEASDTVTPIYQERFQLLVSTQHPLAHRSSVHLSDLHGLPFILRKHCEVLSEGQRVFLTEQAQPNFTCKTDDDAWALMMVKNNLAATLMAESVKVEGTVGIPVVDFGLVRTIGCSWRSHCDQEITADFARFAAHFSQTLQPKATN